MTLLCRLLGHTWRPVWRGKGTATYATVACLRCGEVGWQT